MALNTDALMAKLFKWTTEVDYNGVKFYLRIVGDAVIDDARRIALLESRKLRKLLRDSNSDEYLIHLDPLNDLTDEDLKNILINSAMRDVMREYVSRNPRPVLASLGDHPTQEEQEEYEQAKEEREATYIESMTEYVENWRADFIKTLDRDRDFLLMLTSKYQVDLACENLFTQEFEKNVVANSIYSDDKFKNKMFTVEQYSELPSDLKRKLRDAYDNISIPADELKN